MNWICGTGLNIVPILWMRKLSLEDVKWVAQDQVTNQCWNLFPLLVPPLYKVQSPPLQYPALSCPPQVAPKQRIFLSNSDSQGQLSDIAFIWEQYWARLCVLHPIKPGPCRETEWDLKGSPWRFDYSLLSLLDSRSPVAQADRFFQATWGLWTIF